MSEVWTRWEGQVVDGFPLHRCLGVSDHSGVFLTEDPAHHLPTAALKLVPAIPTLAESQLAYWNAAAALSHPRLLRLLSMGRCQLESLRCLYVVMEYAEQNLAHFLAQRALTDIEVREMMPATLDALAYLHSRGLVHGQLKPSNILVVGDQLKLASDAIRPAGEVATSISMVSVYDPPEGRDGSFSTAGDIWALGVTLYEALTRTTPAKPDERSHGVVLPPDFPPGCAEVIRECLSRRPADRPTVANLQAWASGPAQRVAESAPAGGGRPRPGAPARPNDTAGAPSPAAAVRAPANEQSPMERVPQPTAGTIPDDGGRLTIRAVVEREPPMETPRRSFLPFALAAVVVLVVGWLGLRLLGGHSTDSTSSTPPANPPPAAAQPTEPPTAAVPNPDASAAQRSPNRASASPRSSAAPPPAARQSTTPPANDEVVHQEMPKASRNALATIHGHIRVAVRVTVDSSGNVVDDTLTDPGPSRYFARVASQAARKWKFSPAPDKASRQWVVHFEFSRTGQTAHAVQKS